MDDRQLLREYIRSQSQEAFRELVARHLPMVYSTARRMVRDDHLAEDIAQDVFAILVRKAGGLGAERVVGGWLYNTTRHLAMHTVRAEQRRRRREEIAVAMQPQQTPDDAGRILEQLEPAMTELEETERNALVLRFFEDRSLREVGLELGISEEAARKRVNRAVERLRTIFWARRIAVSSVVLSGVLAASSTTAVPAGLSAAISAAAVAGATAATATTTTTTQAILMSMFNAKTVVAAAGAALLAASGVYLVQQRHIERLRAHNQALATENRQLSAERESAAKAAETARAELSRVQQDSAELLRLRNEVGQLRRERDTARQVSAKAAAASAGSGPSRGAPGRYITKDELAFVGYTTPEAAVESTTWAMIHGTYEQANAGLSPELQQDEQKNAEAREHFERTQAGMAGIFKGMQVIARKAVTGDRVELKIKFDADPMPGGGPAQPPFVIQPMVKVGSEWRFGGSTRPYSGQWEEDGRIEPPSEAGP